jgi:hypothetical protein
MLRLTGLLGAIVATLGYCQSASAIFFDFHNLGNINASSKSLTVDGLTLSLSATGGKLVSTATRFGIDGTGTSDVPDLIDGGNGTSEVLGFIFSNNFVVLDNILISGFDGDDAGLVNIKGRGDFPLANGLVSFNGIFVSTSFQTLRWSGPTTNAAGLGFSVDGLNAHIVPEPSTLELVVGCAFASAFFFGCGAWRYWVPARLPGATAGLPEAVREIELM